MSLNSMTPSAVSEREICYGTRHLGKKTLTVSSLEGGYLVPGAGVVKTHERNVSTHEGNGRKSECKDYVLTEVEP